MRLILRTLAVCMGVLAVAGAPLASNDYPTRPIRFIVPFAPGGSTDVAARIIAPGVGQQLGATVIVENKPGAASVIGIDAVAKSPPDGYTFGIANVSFASNPFMLATLAYDARRDLVPVSLVTVVPLVLAANPSLGAKSVADLLTLAKARPDGLDYASGGNASPNQLSAELFNQSTGARLRHVPYQGGAAAVLGTLRGDTAVVFATVPTAAPHFATGKLVALAVTSPERNAALPDVPTLSELGYRGFEAYEWQGLLAPAGTPQAIVDRVQKAVATTLRDPAVREKLKALGATPVGSTQAEFKMFLDREFATWERVVKEANIRPQ